MDGTILQQGTFTSKGSVKAIKLRADIDFLRVFNYTVAGSDQTTAIGVAYYWQRGMPVDGGIEYKKSDSANADNMIEAISSGGFTLIDSADKTLGGLKSTITEISNDAIPVITNSGVNGISSGDVVRLIDVEGAQQLGGMDFTVGKNTLSDTTFSLDYMSQIVSATTGSWRKVNFDQQFYPTRRSITSITKASKAILKFSVQHKLEIGQSFKIEIPVIYGMQEMNGLSGSIIEVNTDENTITVDIDSSGFSSFEFPLTLDVPFSRAEIIPVGTPSSIENANYLGSATKNITYIGILLASGLNSPAGSNDDKIFWQAGKSFSVENN
ncbi:MAG: hypothetical protein E3J43_08570 [Candidatus Heimdallarchaeota archaeon]|nr:MAG: hypothetical protein E3J43_08570 [Candidatus Heimdallarchaeota archaeon]